jgi:hypothetical protein
MTDPQRVADQIQEWRSAIMARLVVGKDYVNASHLRKIVQAMGAFADGLANADDRPAVEAHNVEHTDGGLLVCPKCGVVNDFSVSWDVGYTASLRYYQLGEDDEPYLVCDGTRSHDVVNEVIECRVCNVKLDPPKDVEVHYG